MIESNLSEQTEIPPGGGFSVRVIGVGGAGANVLDRMALEGSEEAELLTLNTDVRALSTSVSNNKIQLGKTLLKGMGAGGDPELGKQAALEAVDDIRGSLRGHQMAFVCVGLGGGTGSGAAPEVCRVAKEEGVFLVVFATLPFSFEGKRRMDQALEALERIGRYANAVVTFDNDRMGELIVPKEGVQSAFAAADKIISQSIRATMKVVSHPGIIRIGMDELLSALSNDNSRCLFGFGVAKGDNRAHEAFEQAMKSPLLDRGKMLEKARNVLVHVGGGDSMTLYEVELVMQELSKHIDESRTQILFGTGTDKKLAGNLTVTIISSLQGPGGHRQEAAREGSPASSEPEPPAPRLGSPLMAPMSPPPAPAEPEKSYEPVATANPAARQEEPKQSAMAAVEPAPVVQAPPAYRQPEPVPAKREPEPEPQPEPVIESLPEPVVEEEAAPEPVVSESVESPVEVEEAPAPEAKAPELQPVRKTAAILPQPIRKPVVDAPQASRPRAAVSPSAVPAAGAPVQDEPEESIGTEDAEADWADDEATDTIGKMLAAGASQKADPEYDPDETVPIMPVRSAPAREVRETEGEVIVAQTGDSQKISLTRLVPGVSPGADDTLPGSLPPQLGDGDLASELDAAAAQHQQMLQLEPLNKGRFAKTEPTIVDGEDMDVPTFLRKRRK